MAAFSNLGFETGSAGAATGWTRVVSSTFEDLADFGATKLGADNYETQWSNSAYLFVFVGLGVDILGAGFTSLTINPKTADDYEDGWDNSVYETVLSTSTGAIFTNTDNPPFDAFEDSWTNTPYVTAFVGIGTNLTAALFNSGADAVEAFSWGFVSYVTAFVGIGTDLTAASFQLGGGAAAHENFEQVRFDQVFTVNPSTDTFDTGVSNPFTNDDIMTVVPDPAGDMPGNILPAPKRYFLVNGGVTTWQFSDTLGGSAVDVTTTGFGSNKVQSNPTFWWLDELIL